MGSENERAERIDVRLATEWACLEYDNCVVRNEHGIVQKVVLERAISPIPIGGAQFMDLAVSNRVAFNNHLLKVLGADIEDDDEEVISAEKSSIQSLRELLVRFEESGKK